MDDFGNVDFYPTPRIVEQVIAALNLNKQAAYNVYLILSKKFGSGQGLENWTPLTLIPDSTTQVEGEFTKEEDAKKEIV